MTSEISGCGRFIRCICPCFFTSEPQKKEKTLVRYENSENVPRLNKRKVKLLSTEMISVRRILQEKSPSHDGEN